MNVSLKKLSDGVFLISIGIVLLLNSAGYLGWGIWLFYINFWPLLLITAGFKLILSVKPAYQNIAEIFNIVIMIVVFFGGIYFYKNVENKIISISDSVQGDTSSVVNYDFEFGFGEYKLSDVDYTDNTLLDFDAQYSSTLKTPDLIKESTGNETMIMFSDDNASYFSLDRLMDKRKFDFNFNAKNINNFNIDLGAGKVVSKVNNSYIADYTQNIGAGQFDMYVTDNAEIDTLTIKVGAGESNLYLDPTYNFEVNYKVGVGELVVLDEEYGGLGLNGTKSTVAYGKNVDTSKDMVINVDIGAGKVVIKYIK